MVPRPVSADSAMRDRRRSEREQRHDPPIEGIGFGGDARRRFVGLGPRPRERRGDQQRRQQKTELAGREDHRMQRHDRASRATAQRARSHRQREENRCCTSQSRCGAITTSATASAIHGPGVASALRASRSNSRNNASGAASTTTKYFAHSAKPMRETEQHPVQHAAAAQGRMEGVAGERPERQLDHVVIELGGGEVEVMQAVENEDATSAPTRADQRTRGQPDQREGADHRDLRQRVIGGVDARTAGRRARPATMAAAAACRSRAAIRARRSAPR